MAKKDLRYKTVKVMYNAKQIKSFRDIFKHIPKTIVATDLHINNNRMSGMINDPSAFKLIELKQMAKLFGIDHKVIIDLAINGMNDKD